MTNYIFTQSGKSINIEHPCMEDFVIEDIAHGLSNLCRFSGQTQEMYSVAEHSFNVASIVPTQFQIYGLLHDAAEAYLNDLEIYDKCRKSGIWTGYDNIIKPVFMPKCAGNE